MFNPADLHHDNPFAAPHLSNTVLAILIAINQCRDGATENRRAIFSRDSNALHREIRRMRPGIKMQLTRAITLFAAMACYSLSASAGGIDRLGSFATAANSAKPLLHLAHGWHCERRRGFNWGRVKNHSHSEACNEYRKQERHQEHYVAPGENGYGYDNNNYVEPYDSGYGYDGGAESDDYGAYDTYPSNESDTYYDDDPYAEYETDYGYQAPAGDAHRRYRRYRRIHPRGYEIEPSKPQHKRELERRVRKLKRQILGQDNRSAIAPHLRPPQHRQRQVRRARQWRQRQAMRQRQIVRQRQAMRQRQRQAAQQLRRQRRLNRSNRQQRQLRQAPQRRSQPARAPRQVRVQPQTRAMQRPTAEYDELAAARARRAQDEGHVRVGPGNQPRRENSP